MRVENGLRMGVGTGVKGGEGGDVRVLKGLRGVVG